MSKNKREHLFDFYRSVFMLFVFFHHTYLIFGSADFMGAFNPFAELFVGLSGFMVGYIYLHRPDYSPLITRGIIILVGYYSISIPVNIGAAVIGERRESILNAIINTIFFLEDPTWIGILRFYGLIFISLPIILRIYRYSSRLWIYVSSSIFVITTFLYQSFLFKLDNFFLNQVVLVLLQWQLFFTIGLFLGDKYRNKLLSAKSLHIFTAVIIFLGLILHYSVYDMMLFDKFPYTSNKFINLMWSAPIMLLFFYYLFKYLSGGLFDRFIRVVGRNSLVAFLASEIVIQLVKLFIFINKSIFHLKLPTTLPVVSGIISLITIIALMWVYQHYIRGRGLFSKWSR